jgi:hypothetical protein
MDRRKSIKALLIGTAASGVFVEACKNSDKKAVDISKEPFIYEGRMKSFLPITKWPPSLYWKISFFRKMK